MSNIKLTRFGGFFVILREYFMERVRYYREQSLTLPKASDPRYLDMAAQNEKK